jgi:hypothetical protein
VLCGKPSCHQRKNNNNWKQALGPRLHQPGFHQEAQHTDFADFTLIMSIQERYLNASTLKNINLPMSDAHKRNIAKFIFLDDVTVQPLGTTFLPLVFDSLGGFHPRLLQLPSNASPHAIDQPPARSKNYTCYRYVDNWIQAISVANFIETARSSAKTIELSMNNSVCRCVSSACDDPRTLCCCVST